ncbi:hypothetical protein B0J14DRAFT_564360 [Halenospora varia]|nr:hypothetical protein B0J14DRAFT_564360 [Halenospora varia]
MTKLPTTVELAARCVLVVELGGLHILDLVAMLADGVYVKDTFSEVPLAMLMVAQQTGVVRQKEIEAAQVPFVKGAKLRSSQAFVPHLGKPIYAPDGKILVLDGRPFNGNLADGTFEVSPILTKDLPKHCEWFEKLLYSGAPTYKRTTKFKTKQETDNHVNSQAYNPGPLSVKMSKFPQHLAFLKSLASGTGKPPAKRSATGAENLGIPKPSKLPRNGPKKKDLFKERVESDDNDGDSQQRFETEASMYNPAPYEDHLESKRKTMLNLKAPLPTTKPETPASEDDVLSSSEIAQPKSQHRSSRQNRQRKPEISAKMPVALSAKLLEPESAAMPRPAKRIAGIEKRRPAMAAQKKEKQDKKIRKVVAADARKRRRELGEVLAARENAVDTMIRRGSASVLDREEGNEGIDSTEDGLLAVAGFGKKAGIPAYSPNLRLTPYDLTVHTPEPRNNGD